MSKRRLRITREKKKNSVSPFTRGEAKENHKTEAETPRDKQIPDWT